MCLRNFNHDTVNIANVFLLKVSINNKITLDSLGEEFLGFKQRNYCINYHVTNLNEISSFMAHYGLCYALEIVVENLIPMTNISIF